MKVIVDQETCVGCGLCVSVCGQVFQMKEYKAVVIATPVPSGAEACAKEATEQCPVSAIKIQ